jgi:hypothetical protein
VCGTKGIFHDGNVIYAASCFGDCAERSVANFLWFARFEKSFCEESRKLGTPKDPGYEASIAKDVRLGTAFLRLLEQRAQRRSNSWERLRAAMRRSTQPDGAA